MKKLPFTSRGDFIATATLLFLIIATFLITNFLRRRPVEDVDWASFRETAARFYEQQQWLADSAEEARAARDSLYRSRYRRRPQYARRQQWGTRHWDTTRRQWDTTLLRPLKSTPGYRIVKADLNSCDTSDIVRVPQFGSKRAQKIVEYRRRLGGFYSFQQLREIYSLQNIDLAHCEKYFTINTGGIRKIAVNKATYKELAAHPYIDAYLAKSIIRHRETEGPIRDIDELQRITHAYPELIEKLKPYLTF